MNASSPPNSPPAKVTPPEAVPSFAAALAAIGTWSDLDPDARRDLTSAVTTAARMLGLPPAAVPCDIVWLNQRLFDRPPAAYGMSTGRHRNVLSGLRAVLRRMGLHAEQGYGAIGLSEGWLAFMAPIHNKAQRACLAQLGRFCSECGIEWAGADADVFAAWAEQDSHTRLGRRASRRGKLVAIAYNLAAAAASGGSRQLRVPARRQAYTFSDAAHQSSYLEDRARFEQRLSGTRRSLLGDGPSRPLRPTSVQARLFSLRQAVAALVHLGVPIDTFTSLRNLVDPVQRVGDILDFYHERCPRESGGQLASIAETLRIVAAHHVKLTGEPMEQIRAWARATKSRHQVGLTPKTRDRLRALIQPRPRALLLHLPARLMRQAEEQADSHPLKAARLARLAVALEILLICPMRQGNLRNLQLSRHFQRLEPRGRRLTHIVVSGPETKNSEPIEWPIPPESARLIDRYVDCFRRHLADPTNSYLLAGEGDKPLGPVTFRTQLRETVEREVGVTIHPHLLRSFAAWLYLRANPGAYEDVRRVLGHRSIKTTIAAYIAFETEVAAERFDRSVLQEREASKAVAAHAWASRSDRGRRTKNHRSVQS